MFLRKRSVERSNPSIRDRMLGYFFQPIDAPRFELLPDAPTTIADWTLPNLR